MLTTRRRSSDVSRSENGTVLFPNREVILRPLLTIWGFCLLGLMAKPGPALEFPGPKPGPAQARLEDGRLALHNGVIAAAWDLTAGRFNLVEVVDRISGETIRPRPVDAFAITLADGRSLGASQFRRRGEPTLQPVEPNPQAVRRSERFAGWRAAVPMVSSDGRLNALWQAAIRDGSNYIRQELTLAATSADVQLEELTLLRLDAPSATNRTRGLSSATGGLSQFSRSENGTVPFPSERNSATVPFPSQRNSATVPSSSQPNSATAPFPDPRVIGEVDGSPVVAGNLFFACEHPMAANRVEGQAIICSLPRHRPIRAGEPLSAASVMGVVPPGQLRRGFLYYLERERARPYRPFVYYISWFDIAAPDRKMNEALCLDRIHAFGKQLVRKRGAGLDAFVFDDGWDDNRTLWQFHPGFPNGFAPLQAAAEGYEAVIGTWISPWGGYGRAKAERLQYGKSQGFETNRRGFSLAGPKYYERFRSVCAGQIQDYGVGYFKFDGVGPGDVSSGAGAEFGPDVEALLSLIADLRKTRPSLFVNATVGTWPSPFWLWYSDSIWRSGRDVGFHGPGSTRQQWLTYRDMLGYQLRTRRGPLYPLNSLKFQSVIYAPLSLAADLSSDPKDLLDDVRMAAASGTQMQEFFVTPDTMTPALWDAVAEAIRWTRKNADVLVDTHGIGGDPGRGEVYGYASWSPRRGILVLRNPGQRPARFEIDLASAFELPQDAPRRYVARRQWQRPEDPAGPSLGVEFPLDASQPHAVDLAPFEVAVYEATPVGP